VWSEDSDAKGLPPIDQVRDILNRGVESEINALADIAFPELRAEAERRAPDYIEDPTPENLAVGIEELLAEDATTELSNLVEEVEDRASGLFSRAKEEFETLADTFIESPAFDTRTKGSASFEAALKTKKIETTDPARLHRVFVEGEVQSEQDLQFMDDFLRRQFPKEKIPDDVEIGQVIEEMHERDVDRLVEKIDDAFSKARNKEEKVYRKNFGVLESRSPGGVAPPAPTGRKKQKIMDARADQLDMTPGTNYVPMVGMKGQLPINENNELVLGHGRVVRIPKDPITRHSIMRRMERGFGLSIYQGRVKGPKTRLGFFRPGPGETRVRHYGDIETAAHEVAHWLDERNPWMRNLYKKFKAEMRGVTYDTELEGGLDVTEGFAEFMRLFITQDWQASARAPAFYDALVKELRRRPDLGDVVFDIQEIAHAWAMQGVRKRMLGRIGTGLLAADRIRASLPSSEDLIRKGLDGLRSIRTAELTATDGATTKAYNMLRLAVGGWASTLDGVTFFGTPKWRADREGLEFSGESLMNVFGKWWGNDDLALYMIARRAKELDSQGRTSGFRPDEVTYGLDRAKENPEFEAIFDRFQAFNKRMLDFAQQSGILSPESRKAMEEMNKSYVPFNRVMEAEIDGGPAKSGGNPFMRLKGSRRNIRPIWESINGNLSTLIRTSLVNSGKRQIYETLQNTTNNLGANFAAKITTDSAPVKIQTEQVLRKLVEAMGLSWKRYQILKELPEGATPEEAAAIQTIEQMEEGAGEMIQLWRGGVDPKGQVDFYMDKGKKVWMEVSDAGFMESIQFLNPQAIGTFMNMMAVPSRALRRGVTSVPIFAGANIARDTANAWLQSQGQTLPVVGAVKAFKDSVMSDPVYQEMILNGGGFATRTQAVSVHGRNTFNPLGWWETYDRALSHFENANRLAEYRATREKGFSPQRAALAGREISTDFAMRGSSQVMRNLSLVIPFLNARLQGLYRIVRIGRGEDGLRLSMAARGTMLAMASLALYALVKDDERYDELPKDKRELNWFIPTGSGENDYILIPKPFESGMFFGSMPERMFQLAVDRNGKAFGDAMLWMLLEVFNFNIIPQVYEPWRQLQKNENFAGAPIIPPRTQKAQPGEQWNYYTSESMRRLGRTFPKHISPAAADHLIRGYLGTFGAYALAASDAIIRHTAGDLGEGPQPSAGDSWRDNVVVRGTLGRFVPREGPLRRTKHMTELWQMVRQVDELAATVALRQKREANRTQDLLEDPENQRIMAAKEGAQEMREAMTQIGVAMDAVRSNPNMSADAKRDRLYQLQRQRNELAKNARNALHSILNPEDGVQN